MTRAVQTGYVQANSARLYYERRGVGPSLLFIPGGSMDSAHFTSVAELLADEFGVVTYDRRGNGGSPRPTGWCSTTMGEQADDVAGLIEALGLAPCAVWGGSLGGLILLELLARRPGLVRAAVVHEVPLFSVLAGGGGMARTLATTASAAVRGATAASEMASRMDEFARSVLGDVFFERMEPGLRARMRANAGVFFGMEVPALVRSLPEPASVSRLLDRVDVPVRFLASREGRGSPPYRATGWLAEHRGAQLGEIPGGHVPYVAEPKGVADELRAFLTA